MKLSDFLLLDEKEKKSFVLHEGVLVAKRRSSPYLILLFQMDHYYVETFCNMNNKKVEEYRAFQNTEVLEPYLEAIPLHDLFSS